MECRREVFVLEFGLWKTQTDEPERKPIVREQHQFKSHYQRKEKKNKKCM